MGRSRTILHDVRSAGASHPYLLVGLAMVLIAMLTAVAVSLVARKQGLSAREMADFQRWRERMLGRRRNSSDEEDPAVEGTVAEA